MDEKVEMIFDNPDKVKPKKQQETLIDTEKVEEKKVEPRKAPFSGPFKDKYEVIKTGNYRIKGKLYELLPGDFIDGADLDLKKKEILVSTRFIRSVGT